MKSTLLFLIAALPLFAQPSKKLSEQPYNMVQMKTAHNSEQRKETLPEQLACNLKTPWQNCCLGIELDLFQVQVFPGFDVDWVWFISHDAPDSVPPPATLSSVLSDLREWHNAHKTHNVVTIYLDPKNAFGEPKDFITQLNAQLEATLVPNIYTPRELQQREKRLLEGAKKNGWPDMEHLRGKFIVVITGEDKGEVLKFRDAYANSDTRLAFVDWSLKSLSQSPDENRVFANINYNGTENGTKNWCALVKKARKAGYVTRVYKENDPLSWTQALEAGVNLLVTDKIRSGQKPEDLKASVDGQYRKVPEIPTCPQ